jgi:integrase
MVTYSQGSVTKSNGKWVGQIWRTDDSGKRTHKCRTLKEQDGSDIPCDKSSNRGRNHAIGALNRWRDELIAEATREEAEAKDGRDLNGVTVREYLGRYISMLESSHSIEKSTAQTYETSARRICEALGDVPVTELTRKQVQAWVAAMVNENGFSPRTVTKNFRTLSQCLRYGVESGQLASNPCDGARLPKYHREQPSALTLDQARDLLASLEAMPQTRVVCAARVSLLSGLRIGEICALTWADVDVSHHTLNVNKAVGAGGGGSYVKGTKNSYSTRTVPMTPPLESAFGDRRSYVMGRAADAGVYPSPEQMRESFVLGNLDGMVIAPAGVSREWAHLRELLGVRDSNGRPLVFHALRHTYATLAVQAGMDIKSLSAILGHSSSAMTLDTYASSDESARRAAADRFAEFMGETPRRGEVRQFGMTGTGL